MTDGLLIEGISQIGSCSSYCMSAAPAALCSGQGDREERSGANFESISTSFSSRGEEAGADNRAADTVHDDNELTRSLITALQSSFFA
jgi:hypothetical protein